MSTVRKVLSVCEAGAPLSEWLTEARRSGRALLILGEQGAGRSAILRELHRLALAQGVTVAETWCRRDAAELPHLPLMHLLESLAYDAGEPAAPLQDALDKWSQNPQAWHLASRLIYPLRELARRQPILLLIDDLHHAHENLQRIIVNWLVALRVEPIGLAMTAATPHKSQLLRELEQVIGERAAGEVWSLRMLTREETAQRVRTMLGNPPDADALAGALHDLTGGNPLFLSEILTSLQTDTTHTPASLASLIPQSLREGVLAPF
jgi:predicted ATPase